MGDTRRSFGQHGLRGRNWVLDIVDVGSFIKFITLSVLLRELILELELATAGVGRTRRADARVCSVPASAVAPAVARAKLLSRRLYHAPRGRVLARRFG